MTETQATPRFDITSLGEAMLRLSVPQGARLDDARQLDVQVAGAEVNVCVALARLGRHCSWVGRLPEHALGNLVLRQLRSDGVDVSAVRVAPNERLGTFFIEFAAEPRAIQVIYDRADSAAARMRVADVEWDYLLDTRIVHLTGITAALSESCYEIVVEAMRRAREANVLVSFDVNFRAKLWDARAAGERLRPLLADTDVLFCKSADAARLFDCTGQAQEQMERLQSLTRARIVYCTFGADGAAVLTKDGFFKLPAIPVHIVDRIGSGDAFAAGALDGILDQDPFLGLKRGLALAAIALSQFGDRVLTTRAELDAVMAQDAREIAR